MSLLLFIALQIGGIALFVSLAVSGFAALGGLGDVPDHRSSHVRMTPTAGGLGIVAGVGAAILFATLMYGDLLLVRPGMSQRLASLLTLGFAVSMAGLIDDRMVLPTRIKFGLILLISLFATWLIGPVDRLPFGQGSLYLLPWAAFIGTALWLFVTTNAVNFMDGVNGLMGCCMAVACAALFTVAIASGAPATALLSGTLCMACLGFLPYNLRRYARVFSGDCGSLFVAFLYAGAVLLLVQEQPTLNLVYIGPLLILPLLTDVLLTLIRKPFVGLRLTEPHNTHIYQRWARAWGSHLPISISYAILCQLLAVFVILAFGTIWLSSLWVLLLGGGLMSGLYIGASLLLPD